MLAELSAEEAEAAERNDNLPREIAEVKAEIAATSQRVAKLVQVRFLTLPAPP